MGISKLKSTAGQILNLAGIKINGSNPWDIQVHNENFYKRVLSRVELGLGESYMDGWWDCDKLDELTFKIIRANLDEKVKRNFSMLINLFCTM